jgi:hypothetical protein
MLNTTPCWSNWKYDGSTGMATATRRASVHVSYALPRGHRLDDEDLDLGDEQVRPAVPGLEHERRPVSVPCYQSFLTET